jgi:tetratricopeptide (TPR) repeat protein
MGSPVTNAFSMASRESGDASPPSDSATSFESFTTDEQRTLAYASAIGSEFDFPLLVAAMGADEEGLAEQLEGLVRRGVLREQVGGDRFAFVEEAFRGRVYRSLTESRLRVLHRKIAEAMERLYPNPTSSAISDLGRHYFLGRVAEKSFDYNRRAAVAAREADLPEVAIHHLENVLVDLAAMDGDHRREQAEVAEELGDLCYATASFRSADRYYRDAFEWVEQDEPRIRARLLLARAEVARENLDAPAATQGATEALRLLGELSDPIGVAQAHRLLARIALQRGGYRDALDESLRALELLPPGADPRFLGGLSIDIGNAFALLGPESRPVAIDWYGRAVERLRSARDWSELARALHNLGVIVGETEPTDGLDHLAEAREAAERAHDARSMGRALLSGVELRLALGELEEAERDAEQAGRLLKRLGDILGSQQVMLSRGLIAEKRGQWDDAERAYTRAVEIARRYQLLPDEADGQFHLARLRLKTRNVDGAREAFRRATELRGSELSPRLAPGYEELSRQLAAAAAADAPAPSRAVVVEHRS